MNIIFCYIQVSDKGRKNEYPRAHGQYKWRN